MWKWILATLLGGVAIILAIVWAFKKIKAATAYKAPASGTELGVGDLLGVNVPLATLDGAAT